MRVVVALGGNALLERSERPDADVQQHHVDAAVEALAPIAAEHELVVTHGNGPQVGILANESERDVTLSRPYPFDALGAQTQGMIGYWLLQSLENALSARSVAAVVTQTVVDAGDPAFATPSKFVGPMLDATSARRVARERGWTVRQDDRGWRRVVPSPTPLEVVELPIVELLLGRGAVVICAGGGGVPVVRDPAGRLRGVEAVVDKDLTAALLARKLRADALVILTDVDAVEADHGTPSARPLGRVTVPALRAMSFPAGSMGPKVEAVCRFVEETGGTGAIGRLAEASLVLAGKVGTLVEPG
ncbi:MAG TPA: carbamate kinase [Acidimicrobiales bacterium]|nr:carbamate kinase [Acidimicrobiales bacterium]